MQSVLDYLKENQSRFVSELCEYVRFPSVSAQPQHRSDIQACANWVLNHCRTIGLDAQLCSTQGNPVIIAKKKSSARDGAAHPHFVVYGHYDVQPPDPIELWKSPPFEPHIEGRA